MKKFIILIFISSLLFAVKPVPRAKRKGDDEKSKVKVETVVEKKNKNKDDKKDKSKDNKKDSKKDHFKDADSNSVNDQREDDLQKIKFLKTKHKELKTKDLLKGLFNKIEEFKKPKKKSRKKK